MFSVKFKILAVICLILICFSVFTAYFSCIVKPIIFLETQAYIKTLVTSTVSNSLKSNELDKLFNDTFSFKYDNNGGITAFSSNMLNANRIRSFLSEDIIKNIKSKNSHRINVPIGTLSGVPFLYGKGYVFSFDITPLFGITCDISSEFSDAGINQTIHKLKLNISAESSLKESFIDKKITVEASIPISESIIVGDIPEAYTVIIRAHEDDENDINDYAADIG